jgi:hypothetical protein
MSLNTTQDPDPTTAAIDQLKAEFSPEEKISKLKTCSTSPLPETGKDESRAFDPARIFYSTDTAAYFVDVGSHYRAYGRKMPIKSGIRRHLERQGVSPNDIKELIDMHLEDIELDRAVDWVGAHPRQLKG